MPINFPNNPTLNQVYTIDQKSWRYNGTAWNVISSGYDLSTSPSFTNLIVSGQPTVIADTAADTLTLVAGSGIAITTNAGTDTITLTSVASTGNITIVGNVIDSTDSSAIVFTPSVQFDSDITVGTDIVFPDGTRQSTSAQGIPGPQGAQGPAGASGAGTGDVLSSGGSYVDNAIVRYDGVTGTIIQVSAATITDAGLLSATNFSGGGASLTALDATQLTSGTVPDARFPATLPATSGVNLTALNATNLGSGTVPNARFPATLPATSGVNLTALNATQLTSGTVPVLRLGDSGTRDGTTYLRGDNVWATVAGGASSNSFATVAVSGQSNVVAASATDTLTLVAGSNITITTNAGTDTITIAAASGGGTASDSFATIAVAGQTSVVADSSTDTLTLVAGTGITLATNASTDTITITNSGTQQNVFSVIAVAGQSSVEADTIADTLTLAAGTGINITTNAGTDTVTITSTASGGATAFTGLSDASNLTVDQFYLPAITRLFVIANGSSSYSFDQYSGNNPTIYAISGTTIAFDLSVGQGSHPFAIRFGGSNYNTGLTHVTNTGVVTTGASAQGKTSGTLYWKLPANISGAYQYICLNHSGGMVGVISIKDFSAI